ncbi:MAG TPA: alanine racemase [Acidimicrobiia bacterium]|nr:alanine racemase [Acidimicrobiia bacterium]
MRPTRAEIDLAAIRENVRQLAALVKPAEMCAVVKADAYGHGDVPVAEAAVEAGAARLAVALVEEGVRLREAGVEAPILVLSEPSNHDAAEMIHWGLTPTAYRTEFLHALAAVANEPVAVHLKIDTGMHRVGAPVDDLSRLVEAVTGPLRLGAVWTHFAVADEDPDFTTLQLDRFRQAAAGLGVPFHLANTAGAILFPKARADMVRVGLGVYGLHPCPETRDVVELRPAMRVVSEVVYVRRLPAGSRPSYGRRRALEKDSTVVTVPIGYADGMPRRLSDTGGEVLIGGRRYPLAGTVTMDQIVVDVGDDRIEVGAPVVLLGRQGEEEIGADEWAERVETISYEVVCDIGPRVPRRYVE